MRGLGRASVMPLRAAKSITRRRHRPELPFMPGRGADIGPENEVLVITAVIAVCRTSHRYVCCAACRRELCSRVSTQIDQMHVWQVEDDVRRGKDIARLKSGVLVAKEVQSTGVKCACDCPALCE